MSSYFRFWRHLPPPPHKISNNILIYLTFYQILAPQPRISLSLRSLSVVVFGEGGHQNPTKDNGAPPLCH